MVSDKEKLRKKLEALKRFQQTNDILEKGGIQNVALQTSADDQRPSEDTHVLELIEQSKIRRQHTESAATKKQHSKTNANMKKTKKKKG